MHLCTRSWLLGWTPTRLWSQCWKWVLRATSSAPSSWLAPPRRELRFCSPHWRSMQGERECGVSFTRLNKVKAVCICVCAALTSLSLFLTDMIWSRSCRHWRTQTLSWLVCYWNRYGGSLGLHVENKLRNLYNNFTLWTSSISAARCIKLYIWNVLKLLSMVTLRKNTMKC